MTDGVISIRHRVKAASEKVSRKRTRNLIAGTYQFRMRGQSSKPHKVSKLTTHKTKE